MTDTITLYKKGEIYMQVDAPKGVRQELSEFFSYYAAGYQFNPKFKSKMWDGKIRLFNVNTCQLYIGLMAELRRFCDLREYNLVIDKELQPVGGVTEEDVMDIVKSLGTDLVPHDYQIDYVLNALNNDRSLSISPTSSGKSFTITMIQQYYQTHLGSRTLVVVPTVSLVLQMQSDMISYGVDPEMIHTIKAGSSKITNHPIVISTWQSLIGLDRDWFRQFEVVCGDEAHLFTATSLIKIMEYLSEARYRHGFSGTIPKSSKVNKMLLEGVFGCSQQYVTTRNLIDNETVADFNIKALVLKHPPNQCKAFAAAIKQLDKSKRYAAEQVYINNHNRRNKFITNLVGSLKDQNVLVLFDKVEKHGAILKPLLESLTGRVVHYIHGKVSGEKREAIRKLVENDDVEYITFEIGDDTYSMPSYTLITLSDGVEIEASSVTPDDDISDEWLANNRQYIL